MYTWEFTHIKQLIRRLKKSNLQSILWFIGIIKMTLLHADNCYTDLLWWISGNDIMCNPIFSDIGSNLWSLHFNWSHCVISNMWYGYTDTHFLCNIEKRIDFVSYLSMLTYIKSHPIIFPFLLNLKCFFKLYYANKTKQNSIDSNTKCPKL